MRPGYFSTRPLNVRVAPAPETEGVELPWWLAAVERVVKTFAQALAAGFLGATLLTDVAWSTVIQAAAIAALTSLLRLILATVPADPTPASAMVETVDGTWTAEPLAESRAEPDLRTQVRNHQDRTFP